MSDTHARTETTITALRPLSRGGDLSATVVAMLKLLPDVTLTIRGEVRPGGLVVRIAADGAGARQMLAELAGPLGEHFETSGPVEETASSDHRWWGRPQASDLGFAVGALRLSAFAPEKSAASEPELWRALGTWPGGGLDVTLVGHDRGFAVTVGLSGASAPPLRVRAAATAAFQGLTFGQEEVRLRVDEAGAASLLLLPLATSVPLPGFRSASAPALPVQTTTAGGEEGGLSIGTAVRDDGTLEDARLGEQELLRHVHVVGATGTGKSTLLSSMVHQIAHSGHGALVLDPHGTLVDRILAELPAEAAERCLVIGSGDLELPMPLNPLAADDPTAIDTAISDMGAMFTELFDPKQRGWVGPRFEDRLSHALRGLVSLRGSRASLLDVPFVLGHNGMRKAVMLKANQRDQLWWMNDLANQSSSEYGELVSWTNCKFERFAANPALRAILGTGADGYEPHRAMDEGRIMLVDLAKGTIGDTASRLLGYLLLNRFWTAAMTRSDHRRFHVIVDEAHSVMAGSLVNMLSEGRKFGLSVTVAHQFLGQLDDDVAEALSGNVATTVAFRTAGPHVVDQVRSMGSGVTTEVLAELPTFDAVVIRAAGTGVTARPHTVRVEPAERNCRPADPSDVVGRSMVHIAFSLDGAEPLDPSRDFPVNDRPRAAAGSPSMGAQPAER